MRMIGVRFLTENTTDLTDNKDKIIKVKHPITNGIEPYGKLADDYGVKYIYISGYRSVNDFKKDTVILDDILTLPYTDCKHDIMTRLFIWTDNAGHKHGICVDISDSKSMTHIIELQKKYNN